MLNRDLDNVSITLDYMIVEVNNQFAMEINSGKNELPFLGLKLANFFPIMMLEIIA